MKANDIPHTREIQEILYGKSSSLLRWAVPLMLVMATLVAITIAYVIFRV